MATEVVLTGTGVPTPSADRAQAGTLVRVDGGPVLQFDAGRATLMRLMALGVPPTEVDVVFVTHHHYDHLVGLPDLVMTRWVWAGTPLRIVAPAGPAATFCERMLDVWSADLESRMAHTNRTDRADPVVETFEPAWEPIDVWSDGAVTVSSVLVRHPPVEPAVGYRIDTPDGSVVISGDTAVCEEVEHLAAGADVLVHEVCRSRLLRATTDEPMLLDYHADSVDLGAMAQRIGVPTLMLTHLIPAPRRDDQLQGFVDDVREGGYTGEVVIGPDLTSVRLG